MDLIVVGVDGSETAERAAREAARLAQALGCRLHIVTALTKARSKNVKAAGEAFQVGSLEHAESLLADLAGRVIPDGVERSTAVVNGKPAEALVEEAERVGATIIVVGNVHMQGASRVLGAIASDVAHHAPCSVYIAKTT
jgi:nucleotide-binding universal stress UspA family protein